MKNKQEQDLELKNAELEKQLAAKNHELEIEASLERVRAVAMGMTRPEDLLNISRSLFKELQLLEFSDLRNAIIHTYTDDQSYFIDYDYSDFTKGHISHIPYSGNPILEKFVHDIRKTKDAFTEIIITGKELKKWQTFRDSNNEVPDERLSNAYSLYYYMYSIESASIGISAFTAIPAEKQEVLKRFRNVFDLAYRRYVDIRLAEIQIREAQIELGLECVRARAMAMQSSVELADLIAVVFGELGKLNFNLRGCGLYIVEEATLSSKCWIISPANLGAPEPVNLAFADLPFSNGIWKAWKERLPRWVYTMEGADKQSWHDYLLNESDFRRLPDAVKAAIRAPEKLVYSFTFSNFGGIQTVGEVPLSDTNLDVLSRFGKVFDLTYTRFNDLKQAEAQAREALLELALERVRARTMAMQKSDELRDIVKVVFERLQELNFAIDGAAFIATPGETSKEIDIWAGDNNAEYPTCFRTPFYDAPMIRDLFEAKESGSDFFSRTYSLDEKNKWFAYAFEHTDYKYLSEELKNRILGEQCLTQCFALAKNSGVGINFHSQRVLSDIETDILKRFSKVFEQSYIRFLDLQRAEAQVREAQVEAALERVRSKTMAMHSSSDVADTTAVMFDELIKLGVEKMVRCGIGILNPDSSKMELWTAKAGKNEKPELVIGHFDMNIHPMLKGIYDSWHKHEPDFSYVLTGDEMVKYFEIINNQPDYPIKYKISELPSTQYQNDFFFAEGALFAFTSQPLSDGISSVFKRFAGVFGQTYRRYLDLQKAEAQTHEAIKQASLDRVRGEIASMRSTEDLERITPLIWNELTILGIPFIRCGVFIVNEEEQLIHTHLSTADGKALATFNLQFDSEGIGRDVLSAWRNKQIATVYWSKEEFATYTSNLVSQGTIQSKERYVTEHPDSSLDLHFFPFLQGMLYVGNIAPLLDDEKDLVQSLADAFSTAYARYEDFNKLEAAKQQVDNALADLKAAQTKLIQSEKMASLGELTAGIAHEIQNPLNFVNNFSEVNQEMIDELEEELKAGNVEEALAIAAGIKQNEEKISHHGKRADGIVKGMLQHSRTGGGEKQLTNMNILADEFLRLSYHGLRAKDKAFNAEMVTDFDPGLPKISVIAQDMGRVMLNLFNNAFYAVNQKKKTALPDYKPEVSVSTSQENGQVIIKVIDNGTGMPEHVKDKIMQPFFTTKPTGEGTGLGLSLTYDMVVKGHGGSITVNTKEGEGSEFIILLPVN